MTPRQILSENLRTLMQSSKRYNSCPAVERGTNDVGHKVGRTTVQQVLDGNTPFNLDHLDALGRLFGVDPWQLLTPNLDPTHPPVLKTVNDTERQLQDRLRAMLRELQPMVENNTDAKAE